METKPLTASHSKAKTVIDVLMLIVAIVTAWIAWLEHSDKRKLEAEVERLKIAVADLRATVADRDKTITQQREELERSFGAFAKNYRAKMDAAAAAVANFDQLKDTPKNRREMGPQFDREKADRLAKVKIKVQAVIDFVKAWRPIPDRFHEATDGRVTAMDESLQAGKDAEMLRNFAILNENIDQELERLRLAVEAAVKASR